jgi:signal transduction histidine kinase
VSLHIFIQNGELAIIINIRKFFTSIRTKVFLIFLFVSIVPLILISAMLISSFSSYYQDNTKTLLYRQANTIGLNLNSYFTSGDTSYFSTIDAIVDGRALIVDGTGNVVFDTNDISEGKLIATSEIILGLQGETTYIMDKADNQAMVVVPAFSKDKQLIYGAVIITRSMNDLTDAVYQLASIATLLVIFLVILIIVLSLYTSGSLTKPFKNFLKYTEGILDGRIDKKLDLQGNYEIEEITTSFNKMIEKLWEIEENRQHFVANVSHELKTPHSSIKVLAESLLNQESAPIELYREFLEDINHEVDRESKIINDLLTIITLDKDNDVLNISKVNVNQLIEDVLKRLKPLASMKSIEVVFESYRTVIAEIDEMKFSLVITNLAENAIKYNREYGLIKVTLNADHKQFILSFKDTGIGIPEDSTEKIFERFYRVDKTRSRDTGGTGLGLSIVHKTVIMHNGSISCESEEDKGTTFTMLIPLKFIKS